MANFRPASARGQHRSGQTLIIAIIILGVLLILGFAFAQIIGHNITETGRSAKRTQASDLSKAGIEYAHYQLQFSASGGDWRPTATPPQTDVSGNFSKDPDALYLRVGSGLVVAPDPNRPLITLVDLGGPDYRGPYSRVNYARGRSLIRVLYAPADYSSIVAKSNGILLAGLGRGYTILESVGRPGAITSTLTDPTQQNLKAVQVAGFVDGAALQAGQGDIKAQDALVTNSRKLIAYASIGMLESARYITNKDKVSRPAEIGFPSPGGNAGLWSNNVNVGAKFNGTDVVVPTFFGTNAVGVGGQSSKFSYIPGGGSIYANASLQVHGGLDVSLNRTLGEAVSTTGDISPANSAVRLNIHEVDYIPGTDTWGITNFLNAGPVDSTNPGFSTFNGMLRDGSQSTDAAGFVRGTGRKEAPSILTTDPQGGSNRFDALTSQSGALNNQGRNIGSWGYGRGIYVDSAERANRATTEQRATLDPAKSLPNDWLNPNNANSVGWVGPYYVPLAPYLHLLPDGFEIIRDSRSANNAWRVPASGQSTGQKLCRYFTRYSAADNKTYIINNIQAPGFNSAVSDAVFKANGAAQEFNGVLKFAGDVRVRGVIPTNVQLTVVAMGSIYIEGSITKGIVGRRFDNGAIETLAVPSASMLMLMANDYVTINTTQFFAPAPGQVVQAKNADNLPDTPNPIEIDQAAAPQVDLMAQFLLDPKNANPTTWKPYAEEYAFPGGLSSAGRLSSNILMTSAGDDGGPTFASMDIYPMTFADVTTASGAFLFPRQETFATTPLATTLLTNAAGPFFTTILGNVPVYGWGDPSINAYPKFETLGQRVFDASVAGGFTPYSAANRKMSATAANPNGLYSLAVQDPTLFMLRLNTVGQSASKNLEISRTAIAPFDVRIEAALFAEQGSFFVIPGNWFNPNNEDTRPSFENRMIAIDPASTAGGVYAVGNALGTAQVERYQKFGNGPEVPFYGEPIDVKINIVGSITENMPAPMTQQTEWLKKWGWIPSRFGGAALTVPVQHTDGVDIAKPVPLSNLNLTFDPVMYAGQVTSGQSVRTDGPWTLPPMPKLPVSPTLVYFGDNNP